MIENLTFVNITLCEDGCIYIDKYTTPKKIMVSEMLKLKLIQILQKVFLVFRI